MPTHSLKIKSGSDYLDNDGEALIIAKKLLMQVKGVPGDCFLYNFERLGNQLDMFSVFCPKFNLLNSGSNDSYCGILNDIVVVHA